MIKNITLLLLFTATLINCSSNDDNQTSNVKNASELILGTWNIVSQTEDGIQIPLSKCRLEEAYSFDSSGNYTVFFDNESEECASYEINGTYTVENDNVTFAIGRDTYTQQIQNISNNQLVLREVYTKNGKTLIYIDTYEKK